jgi:hypothetical protein
MDSLGPLILIMIPVIKITGNEIIIANEEKMMSKSRFI